VSETDLAERFDTLRPHLHAVAYRLLGSMADADDAVQESWLRLARSDSDAVTNLGGWLTTVVGRVALDMLRTRAARRESPLESGLPDPVVSWGGADEVDRAPTPEDSAVLVDSVSLALLVVLESLSPVERLVFVLHDLFAVPFEEISAIVGRSSAATKQLASRARARVRGRVPAADPDPGDPLHREVVLAFLAAARGGDLAGLMEILDADVVLRVDRGPAPDRSRVVEFSGAADVARQALTFARLATFARPAVVNGGPGVVTVVDGELVSVQGFAVRGGRIVEIDLYADRERLGHLDLEIHRSPRTAGDDEEAAPTDRENLPPPR
jgi:RNA polymerase sigma factor (sigma-70 family)